MFDVDICHLAILPDLEKEKERLIFNKSFLFI